MAPSGKNMTGNGCYGDHGIYKGSFENLIEKIKKVLCRINIVFLDNRYDPLKINAV